VKQATMHGLARVKSKESEKHPFQAQNDLILTIFGQKRANLSMEKAKNFNFNYTNNISTKI
jgi:hypothetical protein